MWSYAQRTGSCSKTASSRLTVIRKAMTVRTIQTCKRFTTLDLFRKAVGASRGRRSTPLEHGPYVLRWSPASGTDRSEGTVSSSRATQRSLQDALLRRVQSENNCRTAGIRNKKYLAEFQTQDVQQDKTA